MRNTLTIEKGDTCTCSCIDSVADDTNSIFVSTYIGNVSNPKLLIYLNGTLQKTAQLEANALNLTEIPSGLFIANAIITFRYQDDDYVGEIFTINFPTSLKGTLSVKRVSEYVYTAKYTVTGSNAYTGGNTSTINVSVSDENKITANINSGSIQTSHLASDIQSTLNQVATNKTNIATLLSNIGGTPMKIHKLDLTTTSPRIYLRVPTGEWKKCCAIIFGYDNVSGYVFEIVNAWSSGDGGANLSVLYKSQSSLSHTWAVNSNNRYTYSNAFKQWGSVIVLNYGYSQVGTFNA